MNKETIRKCAELAARQQLAAFGVVEEDIQALLAELDAADAAPKAEPPTTKKKAK